MRTLFFGLERLALRFIIGLIINAVVLWISQIVVLPKEKERSFLSVLMLALIGAILTSLLSLIRLIGWLGLALGLCLGLTHFKGLFRNNFVFPVLGDATLFHSFYNSF